jgi:hypothetical protein
MARIKEQVFWGKEPTWDSKTRCTIHEALYWYRNMKDDTIKKAWAIEYLSKEFQYNKTKLDDIPDFHLSGVGAIARMVSRGFEPDEKTISDVVNRVDKLINKYSESTKREVEKPNGKYPHQIDPIGTKIGNQMSDFDVVVDGVISGDKQWKVPEISDLLNRTNLLEIRKYYQKSLDEYQNIYDSDENEDENGYNIPRLTLRRLIKLHEEILDKLQSKISVKSTKTIRKKKKSKVSPVKKLKYLTIDKETGISSKNPEKIVGASKLVVFNTKNRQLIIYYANESGFSVKGTTLQNFDSETSCAKILRKPKDQLPKFVTSAKLKTDKLFNDINAVKKTVTGRINSNCIIVNIFK